MKKITKKRSAFVSPKNASTLEKYTTPEATMGNQKQMGFNDCNADDEIDHESDANDNPVHSAEPQRTQAMRQAKGEGQSDALEGKQNQSQTQGSLAPGASLVGASARVRGAQHGELSEQIAQSDGHRQQGARALCSLQGLH
jgi:hypothetical protein